MARVVPCVVFLASGLAASITAVTVDAIAGMTAGLNYRVAPPEDGIIY
jgi:hypothetical protein